MFVFAKTDQKESTIQRSQINNRTNSPERKRKRTKERGKGYHREDPENRIASLVFFFLFSASFHLWDITRESQATRWHCSPTCEPIFAFLVEQLITDASSKHPNRRNGLNMTRDREEPIRRQRVAKTKAKAKPSEACLTSVPPLFSASPSETDSPCLLLAYAPKPLG